MKWLATFLAFLFLFSLYFIELPFSGSLPGKVDSWFYVATFEYLIQCIEAALKETEFGNSLYPEISHLPFGNFSPGLALIYGACRFMGLDIIWSFWALLSITFAGNALGSSILMHSLKIRFWPAVCASVIVACNNYTVANVDNIDALFWGPGLMSIGSLIRFEKGDKKSLWEASLLLGSQLLCSSYLFLISSIFWVPYALKWAFQLIARVFQRESIQLFIPLMVLPAFIFPFFYIYFFQEGLTDSFNPAAMEGVGAFTGLHLPDLISYLPSSLYSNVFIEVGNNWYEKAHCAGLGFLFPAVGIIGLFKLKHRVFGFGSLIIFLLIAIGPILYYHESEIKTPLYWLSDLIAFNHFFRINIRAILAIILLLGIGYAFMLGRYERSSWMMLILPVAALLENIPLHHRTYGSSEIIKHTEAASRIGAFKPNDVILHLPSSFYTSLHPSFADFNFHYQDPELEVMYEYSYMLFQSITGTNVLNGFTGFIPNSRIENQVNIFRLDNDSCRHTLLKDNQIGYVLLHLGWMHNNEGWGSEAFFSNAMNKHDVIFESEQFRLFRVTRPQK